MSPILINIRSFLITSCIILFSLQISTSFAHDIGIVDLSLHELEAGRFLWTWGAATKSQLASETLKPQWPEGCRDEGVTLNCSRGLFGHFMVSGLGIDYGVVVLRIHWLNGELTVRSLTAREPGLNLFGGPRDERDGSIVAATYFELGIEHILMGLDHQAFVISLLFLISFNRRLLWTISAFTCAHSLTLISSTMGWISMRSPPVEIAIALSIVLVASEALKQHKTLTSEWPAPVAFAFGLIHGLGFAGALQDIGLPEAHLITALLTFNLGVETGQLLIISCAWLMIVGPFKLIKSITYSSFYRPILYGIGAIATYWTFSRLLFLTNLIQL